MEDLCLFQSETLNEGEFMKKINREVKSVLGIHDILRIIRIANDITAQELARRLEVSPSYISQIEKNHRMPNIDLLKKYSEVFGIPVSAILRAEEEHKNSDDFSNDKFSTKLFKVMKTIEEWGGLE